MADDLDALTTSLRADPRDPVTIQALADWLEEKGAAPESVRALTVDGPTVLVFGVPPTASADFRQQVGLAAQDVVDWIWRQTGQPMRFVVMDSNITLRAIKASQAQASGGK